ncbi:winged helix-turn-helix domain-containing protein [Campylobacter coli]|uniref:winged helix-turn-helix domain-containing protein n=1 Tax=Campylobacter coli TaxID=195 RepID=UPI000AB628BF
MAKEDFTILLVLLNDIPLACNFLAYCDGQNDIIDIANILNIQAYEFKELLGQILEYKLLSKAH